ncbi:MAG: aspartate-semialdehyde dehydrogenase [Flavobacteriales bacterium]
MRVAVVGASGLVGQKIIEGLEERQFPVSDFIPVASEKSRGKLISFNKQNYPCQSIDEALENQCDLVLFSAGSDISLAYAQRFAKKGAFVIDNSSAWRMDKQTPLVIPELNADTLSVSKKVIANPNCSTIQLLMALNGLHKTYEIDRLVVSTYQSVSGSGSEALSQMEAEREGHQHKKTYPYTIDQNCIPQCDDFLENGYTKEEMKLVNESRKIWDQADLKVTATAVRVPVTGGHSESVNVRFKSDFKLQDVLQILNKSEGLVLKDNIDTLTYPMPLYAKNKDDVFVGRVRRDESEANSLNLWIVADNIRKGAATNAIQIAEALLERGFMKAH